MKLYGRRGSLLFLQLRMKIVFAGTPDFAAAALDAILGAGQSAGWTVSLVLTQPDRPSGRGLKLLASPVKQLALAHGIEVHSPVSLRKGDAAATAHARLRAAAPDIMIVAAYGLILPPEVLDIPRGLRDGWKPKLSAINIHASLLPRWRGAAPIARAIEAGDVGTGVTIMQMEAGLDTGPMLMAEQVAIEADDTAGTLTSTLASLGASMIVEALRNVDQLHAMPQPFGATYARKLDKAEAWLDWGDAALRLECKVRAFNPFPIASSMLNGATIRIWSAHAVDGPAIVDAREIGLVRAADALGVRVACGVGELLLTELQRAGGRRVTAREFIAGFAVKPGDRFTHPSTVATE